MINIRIADKDDISGLMHVHKTTWLATYPCEKLNISIGDLLEKDYTSADRARAWLKRLDNPSHKIWLAESRSAIVGFCEIVKGEPNNILEAIYILPDQQGQGIGRAFFAKVIAELRDEKPLELQVAQYNDSAISFYEKLGFINTHKIIDPYLLPNGKKIPLFVMIKK